MSPRSGPSAKKAAPGQLVTRSVLLQIALGNRLRDDSTTWATGRACEKIESVG